MKVDSLIAGLRAAARQPGPAPSDLAAWRENFRVQDDTFFTAVDAGLHAGQLAFCFAGGYQAALRRLLPFLPPQAFAALLLSEGKKQRPEDLQTVLTPLSSGRFCLDGEKSYVAGGAVADPLLVVARHGVDAQGRARAVLLVMPPTLPGIVLTAGRDLGFLSVLPHARVNFAGVVVEPEMLVPGDAWRDCARPFRTIEDIHVTAAIAAHLAVSALRFSWPSALFSTLLACIVRLADCAERSPTDPFMHILLAGAEREMQQCAVQINALTHGQDDEFSRDWQGNQVLIGLAATARAARLQKAMAIFA